MFHNIPLGTIDYIFLILFILLGTHSFVKGFIYETLSLISLVIAAVVAYKTQGYLYIYLAQYITITIIIHVVSFIIVFVLIYLLLSLLTRFISKILNLDDSIINRLAGTILGLIKAFVIIIIFYTIVDVLIPVTQQPPFITKSLVRKFVLPVEQKLFSNINSVNMNLHTTNQ